MLAGERPRLIEVLLHARISSKIALHELRRLGLAQPRALCQPERADTVGSSEVHHFCYGALLFGDLADRDIVDFGCCAGMNILVTVEGSQQILIPGNMCQ